jgi:hypothetical protein
LKLFIFKIENVPLGAVWTVWGREACILWAIVWSRWV